MIFSIDLSTKHQIVAANLHFYEKPTEPLYLNRTLQYHDLVYLVDGKWTITENEVDYPLEKDDVLLLNLLAPSISAASSNCLSTPDSAAKYMTEFHPTFCQMSDNTYIHLNA